MNTTAAVIDKVQAVPIPMLTRGDLTLETIRRRRGRAPSATGAPYFFRSALPWYSWMFMRSSLGQVGRDAGGDDQQVAVEFAAILQAHAAQA